MSREEKRLPCAVCEAERQGRLDKGSEHLRASRTTRRRPAHRTPRRPANRPPHRASSRPADARGGIDGVGRVRAVRDGGCGGPGSAQELRDGRLGRVERRLESKQRHERRHGELGCGTTASIGGLRCHWRGDRGRLCNSRQHTFPFVRTFPVGGGGHLHELSRRLEDLVLKLLRPLLHEVDLILERARAK